MLIIDKYNNIKLTRGNTAYLTLEIENDSGFVTSSAIPTKTSDLNNDSGYVNSSIIANPYDETSTYAVGEYVTHENNLYKCNTAIATAEEWNAEHWTLVDVISAIPTKTSDLNNDSNFASIDDTSTANNKAWSASKIGTALAGKASTGEIDLIAKKSQFYDYDFALTDLFEKYESAYIDDFTSRASFIDTNHQYTVIGNATNPPTITTGKGAIRTGAGSSQGNLFYSRTIERFPYIALIGNPKLNVGESSAKSIKLFDDTSGATAGVVSISVQGLVSYGGVSYGSLHQNSLYYVLYIDGNYLTIYDDVGLGLIIPVSYQSGKPMNIALGYGTNSGRIFGYGAFIEFIKKNLAVYDITRAINCNTIGEPLSNVKGRVQFTHTYGNGSSNAYFTPDDNPYMSTVQSGISNNVCIKPVIDFADDTGYRTEIKFVPVVTDLINKIGGLQRIKFSADYYFDSNENIDDGDFYTYIFQIHDASFAATGWNDAPPVTLRFMNNVLYASVSYIDDGIVPATDPLDPNRHTTDLYELCNFAYDVWHKIEVECRIGWKNNMGSRLIVKVDGVERLNISTPIGYNIVSSGGYVTTVTGVYCPEWKTASYQNTHREALITNIHWEGTQQANTN